MSGQTLYTPTTVFTGAKQVLSDLSGGTALLSGEVISALVRADTKNSGDVYIGGTTGATMPYSGYGFVLEPGDVISVDIDNPNRFRAMGTVSGYCAVWVLGVR
ncbi:MAG: hypothetical protein ACXQTD_00145 [Candidatus Syntropharchaeia archaeon]